MISMMHLRLMNIQLQYIHSVIYSTDPIVGKANSCHHYVNLSTIPRCGICSHQLIWPSVKKGNLQTRTAHFERKIYVLGAIPSLASNTQVIWVIILLPSPRVLFYGFLSVFKLFRSSPMQWMDVINLQTNRDM